MSFMSKPLRPTPISVKSRLVLGLVTCVSLLLGVGVSSAFATVEAPGWEVTGFDVPTVLAPGGTGEIQLYVYNTGAGSGGEGKLVDTLPAGVTATGGAGCTGETVVECGVPSEQPGSGRPFPVSIPVSIAPGVSGEALSRVTVTEGGVAIGADASTTLPMIFGTTPARPGFSSFDQWFTNADGTVDTQAGSHPYETTLAFSVNNELRGGSELPVGEARDLEFKEPPGLVGNPNVVPQCSRSSMKVNLEKKRGKAARRPPGSASTM